MDKHNKMIQLWFLQIVLRYKCERAPLWGLIDFLCHSYARIPFTICTGSCPAVKLHPTFLSLRVIDSNGQQKQKKILRDAVNLSAWPVSL